MLFIEAEIQQFQKLQKMNSVLLDKIASKDSNPQITVQPLQKIHDRTSKKFLSLKTLNFTTSSYAQTYTQLFTNRCSSLQIHLHKILKVQTTENNFLCLRENQVHLYYENIENQSTLLEILEFRRKNKIPFNEKQAERVLDCVLGGLRELKQLGLYLGMIDMENVVRKDGEWIVSDLVVKDENEDEYESPQQALFREESIEEYCKYRSSLYRLGIIILKILNPNNSNQSTQSIQEKIDNLRNKSLKQKLLILTQLSPHKRIGIQCLIEFPNTKISVKDLLREKCSTRVSTLEVDESKQEKIEDLVKQIKKAKLGKRCNKQLPKKNLSSQKKLKLMVMDMQQEVVAKNQQRKWKKYQRTADLRNKMNLNHSKPSKTVRFYSEEAKKGETPEKSSNFDRILSSRNRDSEKRMRSCQNDQEDCCQSIVNHRSDIGSAHSHQTWIQKLRTDTIIGTVPYLGVNRHLKSSNSIIIDDKPSNTKINYEISQVYIGFKPKKITIVNLPMTYSQHFLDFPSSTQTHQISSFWEDSSRNSLSFFDIEYQNGYKYHGQIKEAVPHGNGTLFSPKDKQIYTGQWKQGLADGWGIQFPNQNDEMFSGYSIELMKLPEKNTNSWISYEGQFVDGQRNGKGVLKMKNGDIFKGFWKNGKAQGHGIYYSTDGTITQGQWSHNNLQSITTPYTHNNNP